MNLDEYDHYLGKLRTSEEWRSVPEGHQILFWTFGTIAPRILLKKHRLILAKEGHFQSLLTLLNTKAATLRLPGNINSVQTDVSTLQDCVRVWVEDENQRRLVAICESKPEAPERNLAFDAHLPVEVLAALQNSDANTRYLESDFPDEKWFDALNGLVEMCSWFYISLTEMTPYNLVILSEETASKYGKRIDSDFETRCLEFNGGIPVWPET